MPTHADKDRLLRLNNLASRLRVDQPLTLKSIAEEFQVSLRTINRDITLLRDQGFPIETERGRGGGVRMSPTWGVGKITLTYQEAVELLVSITTIQQMKAPMILESGKSIKNKFIASFSNQDQKRVRRLARRILIGPTSSPNVIDTYEPQKSFEQSILYECLIKQLQVKIRYCNQNEEITTRVIEPHYMVLNYPVWYVLGWDYLRDAVRTFRFDRIVQIQKTDRNFRLKNWSEFEEAMLGNNLVSLN